MDNCPYCKSGPGKDMGDRTFYPCGTIWDEGRPEGQGFVRSVVCQELGELQKLKSVVVDVLDDAEPGFKDLEGTDCHMVESTFIEQLKTTMEKLEQ